MSKKKKLVKILKLEKDNYPLFILLEYHIYQMPKGRFQVMMVDGQDAYSLGYTSDYKALLGEHLKGYATVRELREVKI